MWSDRETLELTRIKAELMSIVGGLVGGLTLFILTAVSVATSPSTSQPLLFLSNFFIGYSVTWRGSVIGLLYGSLTGAVIAYVGAILYGMLKYKIQWTPDHGHQLRKGARTGSGRHPEPGYRGYIW